MTGTILLVTEGVDVARLSGELRMKHPFYHKDDENFVDATWHGYFDFDVAQQKILRLGIATEKATYGRTHFGVYVQSVP